MIKIGQGYDAHRFIAEKLLRLGGVLVPHAFGLLAHSDGDVLLHAICDAMLGALALGDIGRHFSDQEQAYQDIDSRKLLRRVFEMVRHAEYKVGNVDSTIVAQQPKLAPYVDAMRENLAADLHVSVDCVSVKATTTEKMGFTGRSEGIAAYAVVLLLRGETSGDAQ